MSEADFDRGGDRDDNPASGEKLTARDGLVGTAHAAQLAGLGGPLLHGAAQAVGVADAAKVALDVVQGKEVRPIDVAGATASVTLSAGTGAGVAGPALQAGAQAAALASGLDAAERASNSLRDAYDKSVDTPTGADVQDRRDIETRNASDAPRTQGTAQERARADVDGLHHIDNEAERDKAIAAMARAADRDGDYKEALTRVDPATAEAVSRLARPQEPQQVQSRSAEALRQIERSNDDTLAIPRDAMSTAMARTWVRGELAALKAIDDERDRQSAWIAMGHTASNQKRYQAELTRQDPEVASAVAEAFAKEQRGWLQKEERKAADVAAMRGGTAAVDRLAEGLDGRMSKSELEERGWKGRDDLDDIMQDLQRLAAKDYRRAAELWEKYRPDDNDKPSFLQGDKEAQSEKTPRKAAEADNAVDRGQKEADQGKTEPKESEFLTPESIRKRFIQAENKYFYREEENRLAFEDKGKRLTTAHNDPDVARSMVDLAEAKGWDAVKVKGSEEFKRVVWLQASLRGMEIDGFKPKAVDLAKLEELRAERSNRGRAEGRPAQNVVEQAAVRQRSTEPDPSLDRNAVVDEHQRTLSVQQRQAVEALKAILRDRGDSEQAVNMAADAAAARFQNNRVHVGQILEHGQAPYENNPDNAGSYFVKLQTAKGPKEIWGVDLRRALEQSGAKVGDDVALAYQGRQKVTVQVKERDAEGKVVGHSQLVVDRNTWDVNRLDRVRDEVRQALTKAADRTESRQPLVKVYDRNAPREELRPEVNREPARRHERTR